MRRRLFALIAAGVLAAPLAVAVPLVAQAAPSQTGLSARNVAVCPTPQNALSARCHAVLHELVDRNGKPASPNASTPRGYGPADLQAAYNLTDASRNYGAGQTIAIVDAYDNPNAAADLATYRSQFGLPSMSTCTVNAGTISSTGGPCFVKVNQNGGTGSYPRANGGWAQEISLDLDMASAICPQCNILLVEASSASFSNLGKAVNTAANLGAVAISNSYGSSGDASDGSYGSYYNHPGIAVTASTGDNGYGVGYPATSAFTVAVGGTSLNKDSSSRGWTESAWTGAGSGCSTYQSQPSWQLGVAGNPCGTNRAIADVSAVADPNTGVAVYDSFTYQGASGWLQFGGTSVSAPIIASVYALAKSAGARWSGNPAAAPYAAYAANTGGLYDATGGSNGSCSPAVLCNGGAGWDGPTGLGTPNGLAAFGSAGGGGGTTLAASFTSSCTGLTCTFTDTSTGGATTWSWDFGDNSSTDTSPNPTHTYSTGGTYAVTLAVTDGTGTTSTASQQVTVTATSGTAPAITSTSCTGGSCTFTATGTAPFTWSGVAASTSTQTTSTATATYTSPGGYTVTVSDSTGLSASASVSCGWNGHGRNKTLSCN